MKIPA
jgi:hypothetical protein